MDLSKQRIVFEVPFNGDDDRKFFGDSPGFLMTSL